MKDFALFLIRVGTGATIAAHGYVKLFGGPGVTPPDAASKILGPNFDKAVEETGPEVFTEHLKDMHVPQPRSAAYASGLAEFGGGLGLVFGIKTRLSALAIAANMIYAIKKVHLKNGYFGEGGYEFPGMITLNAIAVFLYGPGSFAIDSIFSGSSHADSHKDEKED